MRVKSTIVYLNLNYMKKVYKKLIKHLSNITPEEKERDWEELKKYNEIGPSIEEVLKIKQYGTKN